MEAARDHEVLEAGSLEIRPTDRMAVAAGRPLILSQRELDLLVALARRPGRVVTREELHAVVWGGRYRRDDRSVDVYVHKLRAKLEDALPDWRFIHTHFGLGYRFSAEPSHPFHNATTNRQQDGAMQMDAARRNATQDKEST